MRLPVSPVALPDVLPLRGRYIRVCTDCTTVDGYIFARYVYYPRREGWWKRSAERSLGKLVAAALPLIYGNRRDSYGKVTVERSIKRRAACPRESATADRRIVNRWIATARPVFEKEQGTKRESSREVGDPPVLCTYSAIVRFPSACPTTHFSDKLEIISIISNNKYNK